MSMKPCHNPQTTASHLNMNYATSATINNTHDYFAVLLVAMPYLIS